MSEESEALFQQLRKSVKNLEMDKTLSLTKAAMDINISANEVLTEGLAKGMEDVGRLYEAGQYFLSELIASAAIMRDCMEILLPKLQDMHRPEAKGKIVIGTVFEDIHDIGKNLVVALASASGFEVIDLGIDVPAEKFVEAVKQYNPNILAISALLSSTMINIQAVIEALEESKVRDKIHLVVGGRPLTKEYAKKLGSYYAEDAVKAVKLFRELAKKKN